MSVNGCVVDQLHGILAGRIEDAHATLQEPRYYVD